jgi:hypothetical protein
MTTQAEELQQAREAIHLLKFVVEVGKTTFGGGQNPVVRLQVPAYSYQEAVRLSFLEGLIDRVGMIYRETDDQDDARFHHPKRKLEVGECVFHSLNKQAGKDATLTLHIINKTATTQFKSQIDELEDKNVTVVFVLQTEDDAS